MSINGGRWRQDLLIRTLGITLGLVAFLAIRHLVGAEHTRPRGDATISEMGLAAIGFLGLSLGGVLACLGSHIHDEVEIAERWRARAPDRSGRPAMPARGESSTWPVVMASSSDRPSASASMCTPVVSSPRKRPLASASRHGGQ